MPSARTLGRAAVAVAIVLLVVVFFAFGLQHYLTLDYLKAQQAALAGYRNAHPLLISIAYLAVYIGVTALSIPGAALLTLAGGALFGIAWGTVLVSFASTLGATVAFLAARYVLSDAVRRRFGQRLSTINAGIDREGAFYLFSLRLVPVVPFWLVNLLMGLTSLRTLTFYWVSQAAMLPGTLVYINAGTELARLNTTSKILSPGLLLSFVLLGLLPLVAKRALERLKQRRLYRQWPRPRHFDYNVVVIGAGAAGLVSSYIAAAVKARVALVEKHRMGGDCLNTGCVPSKALLRSAKLAAQMRRAEHYGLPAHDPQIDFPKVMERVQRIIETIEPHDSVARYTALGVDCKAGQAQITSPYTVEVRDERGGTRTLTTRSIVIAAGARPLVPPIAGLEEVGYYTSDTVWSLRELPRRLVVLGGGPIGCELAQGFARLGAKVTQVEMLPRLLQREDPEIAAMVREQFEREGIQVLVGHKALRCELKDGEKILIAQHDEGEVRIVFDAILCAVGRVPNTSGYGLEELGIGTRPARTIETNDYLETLYPNIYACGDVAGPFQFTHTAAHQAWYATVNALFGNLKKFKANYTAIPHATFTEPEVARVGLNEQEAKDKGIPHEITVYGIDDLDRAIADGEAHGLVKVLTVPGKDRLLGVTIVGEHAGDLIAEFVLAMRQNIGLNKILGTVHIYPTLAEANKYAAGTWKRAHAPKRMLQWLARYHAWRRGDVNARLLPRSGS